MPEGASAGFGPREDVNPVAKRLALRVFRKKTRKTPKEALRRARERMKELEQ